MKKTVYSKLNKTQKKKACELNKRVYYNYVVEKQEFFISLLRCKLQNEYGFNITHDGKIYFLYSPQVFFDSVTQNDYYDGLSFEEKEKLEKLIKNREFSVRYYSEAVDLQQAENVANTVFKSEKIILKLLEVIEQAILKMIAGVEDMRASTVKSIQRDLNDKEMMEEFFENYAIFDSDSLQIIESRYL